MADKQKMSVDEILAFCRNTDAAGGATKAPARQPLAPEAGAAEGAAASRSQPPVAQPPAAPESGAMSTADILAAARAGKAAGAAEPAAAQPAAAKPAPVNKPAPGKAAAAKPGAAKPGAAKPGAAKPGAMNTADILAAARAGKAAGAAAPAAAKPAGADKPAAAKPAAAKAKPAVEKEKPAATAKAAGPLDTTSILAAARGGAKPGPISKAEAAAREKGAADKGKKKEIPPMPEKPAYAMLRPAVTPAASADDRRSFLRGVVSAFSGSALAVGFSSLAVTFNLWTLGFARFMFPNILIEPPTKFKVGFPDELAPGQVQTKYVAQFGVWIVRYEYDGAPEIYALQTVCTHLGCTPNWLEGEQKFKCPCHGSGFYKDGINFEGPAPRPLERFAVRIADDGQLEVDKSRKFKEEMGQWRDPASFVPA